MSNLRIIYDNAADRATLTSSATQGGLGVSNLLSDIKSKVCRSTGTSLSVYAAWPAAETISGIAAAFTNQSPTSTARVRLSNETTATNLLTNTEGTVATLGVSGFVTDAPPIAGFPFLRCIQLNRGATSAYAYRTFATVVGTTYTFSIFVVMDDGGAPVAGVNSSASADLTLVVQSDAMSGAKQTISLGGGVYRLTYTFTATTTGQNYGVAKYTSQSVRGFRVTGYQLEVGSTATSYYPSQETFTSRASTATYVGIDGLLKTAAANAARYQYNPSNLGAAPRLLVEPAATNVLLSSGQFESWGSAPASTRYVAAPDGTITAVVPKPDQNSDRWQININPGAYVNGTVLTVSWHQKTVTPTGTTGQTIALSNWVGATSGTVYSMQAANGFTRYWTNVTITDNSTTQLLRFYTQAVGADDLAAWGWQLETGPVPTSFIYTTTAAVTRAADVYTSTQGVRPTGYIDTWQTYAYDTGTVLWCPAPYKIIHNLTTAQAASAYAYGGGKYACIWLPSKMAVTGMCIDIVDTANAQGYVELSRLICGDCWSPSVVDVSNTTMQVVDTSSHTRTAAGDLYTYVGTRHRKQAINLPSIEAASRKQLWDIMFGNGMSNPLFISTYAGNADTGLEAAHMLYGKLSQTPVMSTPYFNYNAATIEIEEV